MSGLGAIFRRGGDSAAAVDAKRMAAALRAHGPRQQRMIADGPFAMAWAQGEHFTPEDRFDSQPLGDPGGGWVLFAGFLYYRDELVERLGIAPEQARSMADSALAHMAWRKWRESCVDYLFGPYAMIVADDGLQRIVAIRAREGALPLYYHADARRLLMASLPAAIFAVGDVARQLDDQRIADALILNPSDRERSFYAGLRIVPLGHLLDVRGDRLEVRACAPPLGPRPIRFARDADYVEAANELLDRSVASAMRASAPPAIALSGGYDSAAVAVSALGLPTRAGRSEPLASYTAVPEPGWDGVVYGAGRTGDESGHVRALAARYPALDAHFVDAAGAAYDRDLDALIALAEMPPTGMNNLSWSVELNRQARADGHHAMLVGASGNATFSFSGRARYPQLLRSGRWIRLMRELRATGGDRTLNRAYSLALRPLLPPGFARAIARWRGHGEAGGFAAYSAVHPDYAAALNVDARARSDGWDDGFRGFSSPEKMMRTMIASGMRNQGQPLRYAMEAYSGVTSRDPLGDRKIVDFCLGLPPDQFLDRGEDRRLIRRMMAGRLPDCYFAPQRGRQGADWHLRITRDLPRYRAAIERIADNPDLSRRFDVARLRRLVDTWPERTPAGPADHPDHLLAIYGLGRALAMARFIEWAKEQE